MADTAATVNEITTHLFGDALARDLSFGSRIPRAMSARALSSQALDAALGQVADASTQRAPVDILPFLRVQDDNLRPPKPYGGADWAYPNQKEEAEQEQERVWVDDEPAHYYDSDATLPLEDEEEYAYATEAERATDHHRLRAPTPAAPAAAAPAAAVMSVRVCLEWKPKMPKTWSGALPSSARKTSFSFSQDPRWSATTATAGPRFRWATHTLSHHHT
jgi:hypothetical protein